MVTVTQNRAVTPDAPSVDRPALLRGMFWALPPSLAVWAAVLWGVWQILG